jgi:hypothetical protein
MKFIFWKKKHHCVLLIENHNSIIVQRRHPYFSNKYVIARERMIKGKWQVTSYLYTGQFKTIEAYIKYFDIDEKMQQDRIGDKKQFDCPMIPPTKESL